MRNTLHIFILALAFALPLPGAEAIVGSVKSTQGEATVRRGAQVIACREGLHLLAQDVLLTAANGSIGVILQDGTRIAVGPSTELRIDEFVYEPVAGKFGLLLRMAKGILGMISGGIARFSPEAVKVETPVGVVGLRGTHLAISLEGN